MKTDLILQELSSWQSEIRFLLNSTITIEERLDVMHKNIRSNAIKHFLVSRLLERFNTKQQILNDLEKAICCEKDTIQNVLIDEEVSGELEKQHVQISHLVHRETELLPALQQDYYQLLSDI